MSVTFHLNVVMLAGAGAAVLGFLLLAIGVPATWGRDSMGSLAIVGLGLAVGGAIAALIGAGMAFG